MKPLQTLLISFSVAASMTCLVSTVASGQQTEGNTASPLSIGETFTMASRIMGEVRRINVYLPPQYNEGTNARLPVLYMPDGGLGEDFLHIAGLVQVSSGNGTMRPFILVGIENTQRRRDMTGPTSRDEDKKIAPAVGGSAAFRSFIRDELMPEIQERYRTTGEKAIVGESLAGLFVIETLLLEPGLFDTYIAFDPSLWWNGGQLVQSANAALQKARNRNVYVASGSDGDVDSLITRFARTLESSAPVSLKWHFERMPGEKHATIYHPGALHAFRMILAPVPRNDAPRP